MIPRRVSVQIETSELFNSACCIGDNAGYALRCKNRKQAASEPTKEEALQQFHNSC
jgi:hypothetical protein